MVAETVRRALRTPALHFLLLGGLGFALAPTARPSVAISAADLTSLRSEFAWQLGRAPTAAELSAATERLVDERILEAEAWRRGLDRHDSAVATRLARLGDFVAGDEELARAEAIRRSRELGLDRNDPVVRRYLTERMRQLLAAGADLTSFGEDELEARLAEHPERYAVPERIALRQRFRASTTDAGDDEAFRTALDARGGRADPGLGDPSPHPSRQVGSGAELDRLFGPGFRAALDPRRVQVWQGPIPSALGRHWVWIESFEPGRPASLTEARARIENELREAARAERLKRRLAELRGRYDVRRAARIAATSASGTSSGTGASGPSPLQTD